MSESVQDEPGQVVQCETVRELLELYSLVAGPCSLTVCAEAVLKLVTTVNGETVTAFADASWLAALWRMCPGDRRPTGIAALTAALEARSRIDRAVTVADGGVLL